MKVVLPKAVLKQRNLFDSGTPKSTVSKINILAVNLPEKDRMSTSTGKNCENSFF